MSEIKDAIRKLSAKGGFDAVLELAIVKAVNEAQMTCDVTLYDNDELLLEDVKLKPVVPGLDLTKIGPVLFPAIGSEVIIGQLNNDETDLFVVSFTKVSKVSLDAGSALKMLMDLQSGSMAFDLTSMVFNGGKNGGLPKISPLVTKINQLERRLNDLLTAFKEHKHIGVSPGGGISGFADKTGPAKIDVLTKIDDLENKAITQ